MKYKIIIIALLSTMLIAGLALIFNARISDSTLAAEEESAYEESSRLIAEFNNTTTSSTTTTTIPPTTTEPKKQIGTTSTTSTTTTTTLPQSPLSAELVPNQFIGTLKSDRLQLDPVDGLGLKQADEAADSGYEALLGGAALFTSSETYKFSDGRVEYSHDLGIPGSGGTVTIGAHRTTANDEIQAPFGLMHEFVAGDRVVVETIWGVNYTYEVRDICPEGQEDEYNCSLHVNDLFDHFVQYENPDNVETLFLFSCDDGMRVFVRLELVDSKLR